MSEPAKLDLSENDLRIVLQILEEWVPGRPVYVFGSRANGKARRRSDLDLAIGGDPPLTLHQRAMLTNDFDESDLPIEVDVVDLGTVSPDFHQRIQRHWIALTSGSQPAPDSNEVAA
jgi:predicted nucleotidyltransferase